MVSLIRTFLVTLAVTLLVWLWAEGESLTTVSATPRIEVAASTDLDARVVEPGWMGAARVKLRGSRSAVMAAEKLMAAPLALATGLGGVPATPGVHAIDLRDALRQQPDLRRTGVTIDEAEPALLKIVIEEMATRVLPARLSLGRLQADGAVRIEPPTIAVRLPRALAERLDPSSFVNVALDAEARMQLRDDEVVSVPARVLMPELLAGEQSVSLKPTSVTATLKLRASGR